MLVYGFLLVITACLVFLPIMMFLKNIQIFLPAKSNTNETLSGDSKSHIAASSIPISVCIPARNEEKSIGASLQSLLRSNHSTFEILVLDDHSEDQTRSIVESFQTDRIHLFDSAALPKDWNGKQHACWQLAQKARFDWLLFLDADVRLSPDALSRIVAEQMHRGQPLISGFPRQQTGTWSEKILIPMMHYVLLSYLPIHQMRQSTQPGMSAGCGQLFFVHRDEYFRCGGHSTIASSRHDGIQLPRLFRKHGFSTDIFDATDIATCRMYESLAQVQRGLLKNATEGIANSRLIVPFTILLIGGTWLPLAVALAALKWKWDVAWIAPFVALFLVSWTPRLVAAMRFKQSWFGALLHPVAVLWFVALQWIALIRSMLGLQIQWRGRV